MNRYAVSTSNFVMFAAKKKKKSGWSNIGGKQRVMGIYICIHINTERISYFCANVI